MWNFLFGIKQQQLIAPSANSLRTATISQHRRIEHALELPVSIESLADYRQWLARYLGIYQPLEDLLAGFTGWPMLGIPDIQNRARVPALRHDLSALGYIPADMREIEISSPETMPHLETLPAALGSLYVLENSMVNDRAILKDIPRRLGRGCKDACAFYAGHGRHTNARWESLKASINRFAASQPAEFPEVVAGAKATFAAVHLWMLPLTCKPALATIRPSQLPGLRGISEEALVGLSIQV